MPISLPAGRGVKFSIIEERDNRKRFEEVEEDNEWALNYVINYRLTVTVSVLFLNLYIFKSFSILIASFDFISYIFRIVHPSYIIYSKILIHDISVDTWK